MFDEPVPVATQFDLANVPRACNAADRAASPRVVVPYQTGTRHPVLVTDPVEPMRVLLTGDAVLYGAPSSACAAAYDATVVPESASVPAERAIISVDALDRSWLFRFADGSRDQPRSLEYRAMSCRFDPTSEKPPEVKGQNGT
jgi:hypothetical protein